MCTLAVAFRASPQFPLIVAANRDERLDRPATGPFVWSSAPRFVAPRDERAGGSWLGLSERGLFVAITNRAFAPNDPQRRSRGALVVDALGGDDAVRLGAHLKALDPRAYNAFHLLHADREAAFLTFSDGETLTQTRLGPGLHVVTEQSPASEGSVRARRILERWAAEVDPAAPSTEALASILSEHGPIPPDGTCVHVPTFNYGTRSSAILLMDEHLSASRFLWAEGPPCTTPFVDRSELLRELFGG
jgi:uncharacterized protein with NRDE domain